MSVNEKLETVQVSFRLERRLAERLKKAANNRHWPRPSQTEIVTRGVEMMLTKLKKQRKARGKRNS